MFQHDSELSNAPAHALFERLQVQPKEVGAVALGLLVGVFSQASTLALAMDARGFAGAYRRTWAGPATWRLADTLVVLGGLVPLAAALLAHSLFLE